MANSSVVQAALAPLGDAVMDTISLPTPLDNSIVISAPTDPGTAAHACQAVRHIKHTMHLYHTCHTATHCCHTATHCCHTAFSLPPPGPLNRAEWIKFVSLFFNKEAEANALFDNITAEYERYKV